MQLLEATEAGPQALSSLHIPRVRNLRGLPAEQMIEALFGWDTMATLEICLAPRAIDKSLIKASGRDAGRQVGKQSGR